jgi:tryptophan 2,3-dioxygenase
MTHRTYSSYLQLDGLLSLQKPVSEGPEHDEMLFIVIHQVYELWFKQLLWELDWLRQALEMNNAPRSMATFKRILTIMKTLVAQIDVLETMTPVSFNSFRARLDAASGFQSAQFREVELVLGARRPELARSFPEDSEERRSLEARLGQPTLYQSFLRFLSLQGLAIPEEAFVVSPDGAPYEDSRVRALLVEVYRQNPALRDVCERMVDLDEGLQEWRYRHVKMVQRTIGTKRGTGGSAGAEYLQSTLFKPLFPDLWTIRAEL